jgi:glyceraldehyde 3-phosphate dehydrogenase
MKVRIAINGFGRIGRCIARIALTNPSIELVSINDLMPIENASYLLQYDSAYGIFKQEVSFLMNESNKYKIVAGDHKINYYSEKDPSQLPWGKDKIDYVLECTGRYVKDASSLVHTKSGAHRVIISAPVKGTGDIPTFLLGVNHDKYSGENVFSMASCTTNCIAPVLHVMERKFGVIKSVMNTIHATTNTEAVVDSMPPGGGLDFRRGRSSGHNMIPTTTGAAIASTKALPKLAGLFDGTAVRVPVLVGSLSDIVMITKKKVSVQEVNDAFIQASKNSFYKNVLAVSIEENLVSSDIVGNKFSSIVDLELTKVIDGDLVKVVSWYDNEWGYASRMIDMVLYTYKK